MWNPIPEGVQSQGESYSFRVESHSRGITKTGGKLFVCVERRDRGEFLHSVDTHRRLARADSNSIHINDYTVVGVQLDSLRAVAPGPCKIECQVS